MKNHLALLFMLPAILFTMMMHNMDIVMKRQQQDEDSEEEAPTRFVGRFSDYEMLIENLPEHEMKIGSGISFLLWGLSIMTLGSGAVILWCGGSALLHFMVPDEG